MATKEQKQEDVCEVSHTSMSRYVTELGIALNDIQDTINVLEVRLNMLLLENVPCIKEGTEVPDEIVCPISDEVRGLCKTSRRINSYLQDILSRVDL